MNTAINDNGAGAALFLLFFGLVCVLINIISNFVKVAICKITKQLEYIHYCRYHKREISFLMKEKELERELRYKKWMATGGNQNV